MIELKECFSSHSEQIIRFKEILAPLKPVIDYHFLSLKPAELLSLVDFPKETLVAVSFLNTKDIAEFVLENKLGGHCGHFLLLNKKMQRLHKSCQQKIGTGYTSSKSSLYREINNGVDWVFTNRPFEMKEILKKLN